MSMAANDGERKAAKSERLAGFPPPVGGCAVLSLGRARPASAGYGRRALHRRAPGRSALIIGQHCNLSSCEQA